MNVCPTQPSEPFLLWVEAVGGYWVCRGDAIVFGRPDPENENSPSHVPILGDLARRHVCIRRDGESYLIEPLHEVSVDGRAVRDADWLRDGSRIQLGRSVGLQFRRPNALSGTVRFDFLSRHCTQPRTDAVVWMSDTCILGPRSDSHVVCPDWADDVIVYQAEASLCCRSRGGVKIDGVACPKGGVVTPNSRIEAGGGVFRLETFSR
jgi:hypothetical protein